MEPLNQPPRTPQGADLEARVQAWIAHAEHGDTWKLREQIFEEFAFFLQPSKDHK